MLTASTYCGAMLPLTALLGFCLAVIPITVTPGASFSLVSARGLAGDHLGAWATILGTGLGIFTHGLLAGLGLAVVVMQSAQLYAAIRLIGAGYLIGLGLMFLWNARRRGHADAAAEHPAVATARDHEGRDATEGVQRDARELPRVSRAERERRHPASLSRGGAWILRSRTTAARPG